MGLDQYLYCRPKGLTKKQKERNYKNELIYWRKASAIHNYFVELNDLPDGDNCQEIIITLENLKDLSDLCQEAVDNKTGKNLPTTSGFFFGETKYGEHYFMNLQKTIEKLQPIIDNWIEEDEYYYYAWY